MGHFVPGIFFIILAFWWTSAALSRYYRCLQKQTRYRTSSAFLFIGCNGRQLPIESFLKIFFACLGIIGEMITGMEQGTFKYVGNAQHATMYALFGFSGVIDLLSFFGWRLPKNTDYCWGILAFIAEALLFEFHLHLHMPLALAMHKMLFYSILGTILALALEMKWPENVLATLGRAFCVFLQGTWFLQLGADLYLTQNSSTLAADVETTPQTPTLHDDDMDDLMSPHRAIEIAAIKFSWHMFGIFLFMLVEAGIISSYIRSHSVRDTERLAGRSSDAMNLEESNSSSQKTALLSISDEES